MPLSPTDRLQLVNGYINGESGWDVAMDDSMTALDRCVPSDFGVLTVAGRVLELLGGVIDQSGTLTTVTGATLTMTASATTLIQRNAAGTISASTATAFTGIPLYSVTTDGASVTGFVDHRYPQARGVYTSGKNAGIATLVAGSVTVSTTLVVSTSIVQVTRRVSGGTLGHLKADPADFTANTKFIIRSSDAGDTSTVVWSLINPAT